MQRIDEFPALQRAPGRLYLDSAATTLTPGPVLVAVQESMARGGSAGRGIHQRGQSAGDRLEDSRAAVAQRLRVPPAEVVFTASATAGVNLVAWGWGLHHLRPGQRILVGPLEHHANLLPWRHVAREAGATVHTLPCLPTGELDLEAFDQALRQGPAVLALTHVSNLTGGVTPIAALIRRVRALAPECLVFVDGSQALGHLDVDLSTLGADFYAFAGHKAYGPLGVGVVWGQSTRWEQSQPTFWGGGMVRAVEGPRAHLQPVPWRFEAGTPNHHAAVGLAAALPYWSHGEAQSPTLAEACAAALAELPDCQVVGQPTRRVGLVSFTLKGLHPHDIGSLLDAQGIEVRVGHLCAQPAVEALGQSAVVRASFGVYNDTQDIERLILGLRQVQDTLRGGR